MDEKGMHYTMKNMEEIAGVKEIEIMRDMGSLGGAAVWRLPLARGPILETRDRIPRRASPSACCVSVSLSLSLCDYHK